jgi:hypothetical protein
MKPPRSGGFICFIAGLMEATSVHQSSFHLVITAIVETTFWKISLWMLICGGWMVSIIASFIEAYAGA